jgi:hypothetical protein
VTVLYGYRIDRATVAAPATARSQLHYGRGKKPPVLDDRSIGTRRPSSRYSASRVFSSPRQFTSFEADVRITCHTLVTGEDLSLTEPRDGEGDMAKEGRPDLLPGAIETHSAATTYSYEAYAQPVVMQHLVAQYIDRPYGYVLTTGFVNSLRFQVNVLTRVFRQLELATTTSIANRQKWLQSHIAERVYSWYIYRVSY